MNFSNKFTGTWAPQNSGEERRCAPDQQILDQVVELYQRMCNIPGLRRKRFARTFHVKSLSLRKDEKFLSFTILPKEKIMYAS